MAQNHTRYVVVNCSRRCSLNFDNLPPGIGELVHKWYEEGANRETIRRRAGEMGAKISDGAIKRHKKDHLMVAPGAVAPRQPRLPDAPKRGDLEVIEAIISRGAEQIDLSGSKVSTEQLLRAIELKHRLTEGSVFEKMYAALMDDGEDAAEEVEALADEAGGEVSSEPDPQALEA